MVLQVGDRSSAPRDVRRSTFTQQFVIVIRTIAFASLLALGFPASAEEPRPVVGAIRWDAWSGGNVTEQVERTLSPQRYHSRLPWFADVRNDNSVRIDGSPQAVMDREIQFAANSGLDYWAFLLYQEKSSMSTALGQYLNSSKRDQLRFCLILHDILQSPDAEWPDERDRALALLQEPGYQTVLDSRPLVYTFTGKVFPAERFQEFLALARQRELNPYCVFMGWHPAEDIKTAKPLGFDAVSSYAKPGGQATFCELADAVKTECWENAVYANAPYVPIVTTGWDKSPRKDNPVSWEVNDEYHRQNVFPSRAEPAEIAAHLRDAIKFTTEHADICEANALIIYAWNEYDEGGWIAPTRSPDGTPNTSRVDAVKRILAERR